MCKRTVQQMNYFHSYSVIQQTSCHQHGRILRGGVGRCAPPPPLQSDAPPLGKVSMIDQSENLTFFASLGSTLRKNVFL
jgi:hypothetical protein